ncbi:MAG: hypothetical protein CVU89_06195 [Firmicutes bacterium HGW-Firmicutes-14]|nr:MAG: hypothetical protein CVU89_06195 [Firmicutes bacterium HGW-Firmicutes-14]
MRKFKRMIALVTVALFVLSFAAPVMAKSQDAAVDRLYALDVVNGYPDGSFGLDKEITRAEFAVIAVKLLGLSDAADAAKGPTKFSDVPGNHWASGFINLAVGQRVIVGYPDGTFKPEKNVTYAEAITMIINVLGYGVTVKGTWPTGQIAKAAEIGLLKDMSVSNYNSPALRGMVFLAADNALDINILIEEYSEEQTADGSKTITFVKKGTLLAERLKITELKDKLVDGVSVVANGIKNDQIGLGGSTYDTKGINNFLDFFGLNVNAYENNDDEIVAVQADEDDLFYDKIKSIDLAGDKITFYGAGTVSTTVNVKVYADYTIAANDSMAVGQYGLAVKDGGKVYKFVTASGYDGYGIVDSVENDTIYFTSESTNAIDIDLDGVDMDYVQIFKNGEVADLSDIEAGDVVAYYNLDDKYLILATDATVTGTLKSAASTAGSTFKLTVGSEAVFSSTNGLEYSTDSGDSYDAATLDKLNDDIVGEDVTVLLDPNGEALFVYSDTEGSSNSAKVVVRNITKKTDLAGNTNSTINYIKVTKMDGTEAVYEIDNDDYTVNWGDGTETWGDLDIDDSDGTGAADVSPKDLAKITFDSSGKVTKVEKLTVQTMRGSNGIDKNNDLLYNTSDAAYVVSSSTAIIQVEEFGDAGENFVNKTDKITWATVENNETAVEGYTVTFYNDGKEVVLVFIDNESSLSSDQMYGVAVGGKYGIGGGDYAIKLMVDGTTSEYTLDSDSAAFTYANAPIVFKMNADDSEVDTISRVADGALFNVVSAFTIADIKTVGDTLILVDGSDNEYIIKKDKVEYFDNTGSSIKSITGVSKGKKVELYDFLDKDGDVAIDAGGDNAIDNIFDYVIIVN